MYRDTHTTLSGEEERNRVDLDDFVMTPTDTLDSADGCPEHELSIIDNGGFTGFLDLDDNNDLLVNVSHTMTPGTFRIVIVAKVPWDGDADYWTSAEYEIFITIGQHL